MTRKNLAARKAPQKSKKTTDRDTVWRMNACRCSDGNAWTSTVTLILITMVIRGISLFAVNRAKCAISTKQVEEKEVSL